MTGLINTNPLTFKDFAQQMNIIQPREENVVANIIDDKKPDHTSIFKQIDDDLNHMNKTIEEIEKIRINIIHHMREYTSIIEPIKEIKDTIVGGRPVQDKIASPAQVSLKGVKITMFPSEIIDIPKDFNKMNDFTSFMDLIYGVLIDQYNNLLLVLSQLNHRRLNKIMNKSYPPDVITYHSLRKYVKDYWSRELSPTRLSLIAEFVHGLSGEDEQIEEKTEEKPEEKTDEKKESFKKKGLFQYYLYLFKWLYATWKIKTYKQLSSYSKQLKDFKIKEPEYSKDAHDAARERLQYEQQQNEHAKNVNKLDEFLKQSYAMYDDTNYEVYQDEKKIKTLIDTYEYVELYRHLKSLGEQITPSIPSPNQPSRSGDTIHDKMRETMEESKRQQKEHDEFNEKFQIGGKKRRTRKWYKFQNRAIRNTMKYLRYREKNSK